MFNSSGVKKGLIIDATAVVAAIKKAIKNVENKLGTKINQVIATIPSNNVEISMVTGTIIY